MCLTGLSQRWHTAVVTSYTGRFSDITAPFNPEWEHELEGLRIMGQDPVSAQGGGALVEDLQLVFGGLPELLGAWRPPVQHNDGGRMLVRQQLPEQNLEASPAV